MGIYDREYYRERTRGSGWLSGTTPACKAILALNAALFLLPKFLADDHLIHDWLAAYSHDILDKGQVWRLVTATFLHDPNNLWHVVVNMLFLWFLGREMESFYGTREFWWLYLSAGAVSTLCWAAVDYPTSLGVPMVGASGAIMAVVSLYTFYYPRRELMIFGLFPVEMWLLLTIYVAGDLLGALGRSSSPTAFWAHLGGFGYAVAFKGIDLRLGRLRALLPGRRPRFRVVLPDPPATRETPVARPAVGPSWSPDPATSARPTTAVVTEDQLDARLDEILVKIAREGRAALTDDEKRILEEASRRARNKRGGRI